MNSEPAKRVRGRPFPKGIGGNPHGRPRGAGGEPANSGVEVREDAGWSSILTGFGNVRDKRESFTFEVDVVTDLEAREMWRGDDLVAKVIELLPSDAMRGDFSVKCDDREVAGEARRAFAKVGGDAMIRRAAEYERAYGGAGVLMLVNDGQDFTRPLNLERAASLDGLLLYEPREMKVWQWLDGKPEIYLVQKFVEGGLAPPAEYIHASRFLIFPGVRVTEQPGWSIYPGWGDSILTRMRKALRDYGIAWSAAGALLVDFSQGVYSMEGLTDLMAKDREQVAVKKLQIADLARSVLRMMVVDSKDKFERTATPMAGFPDTLDRLGQRVSAATGIPITKLLGVAASGLNATGEGDEKNWHAVCAAYQKDHLTTPIVRLIEVIFRCKDGPTGGKVPDSWSVEWHPLDEPTALEQAQTRLAVAQADQIYAGINAVSGDDVARSRWSGDEYSPDMHIDFDARDALDAEPSPEALDGIRGPAAAPGASAATAAPAAAVAMNGAQITAMIAVVTAFAQKAIPRDAAITMLVVGFPGLIAQAQAEAMCPKGFEEVAPPPAPAMPPGAGGPPPPPIAPPNPDDAAPDAPEKNPPDAPRVDAGQELMDMLTQEQVDSILEIIKMVACGDLPRDSAVALVGAAYNLSDGDADALVPDVPEPDAVEPGYDDPEEERGALAQMHADADSTIHADRAMYDAVRVDGFNEDQPRDEGGRWGEGGGGGSSHERSLADVVHDPQSRQEHARAGEEKHRQSGELHDASKAAYAAHEALKASGATTQQLLEAGHIQRGNALARASLTLKKEAIAHGKTALKMHKAEQRVAARVSTAVKKAEAATALATRTGKKEHITAAKRAVGAAKRATAKAGG